MPRDPATLHDVAATAGVHVSTASRALDPHRRHLIGDEVVARVDEAARKLQYRRNRVAATLRTGRSMMVAVLTPTVVNPVVPPLLDGIESGLAADGYVPFLFHVAPNMPGEALLQRLFSHRPDGVIVASAIEEDPILRLVRRQELPTVLINRSGRMRGCASVYCDDRGGIRLAVEHLVALGHREIAHLAGPQTLFTGSERAQAFLAACGTLGVAGTVHACETFARDQGHAVAARLLMARGRTGFTAICAASDTLALGVYDAAAEARLDLPRDLSVTGYNDIAFMDLVHPPLTTVRVPHHQIGRLAAQRLLEQLAPRGSAAPRPRSTELAAELVVRGSTARPSSRA